MSDVLIAPSILAADLARLGEEVRAVDAAGRRLDPPRHHGRPLRPEHQLRPRHRQVAAPPLAEALRHPPDDRPVDPYLEAFAKAGADRITVHAEATATSTARSRPIRALGKTAGVVLNPATPESAIEYVLDHVDLVLVMTVNPGFGGQRFLSSQLEKIRRMRAMTAGRGIRIQVDGGITPETAPQAIGAGADVLVAGSAIFGKADYAAAVEALRGRLTV